jgi:superfamily I DNA/RNA helicase
MTMHRAKELSGYIVFIPGLDEETLPGEKKKTYPGLVEPMSGVIAQSVIDRTLAQTQHFNHLHVEFASGG